MSWVTVIWSMTAAACLTLALIHLMVWVGNRGARSSLMFSVCAVTTAGFAGLELWLMHASTLEAARLVMRWYQVPILLTVLGIVGFVRAYLGAGRAWLGWLACGTRGAAFCLNFWLVPNLNFEVTGLRAVDVFGQAVTIVQGIPHPSMVLGQVSLLLVIAYAADATRTIWQRGERGSKIVMSSTIVVFSVAGTVMGALQYRGIVEWPFATSLYYLPVIAVMAYEMSRETFRAARLSTELQKSEARMNLAADSARFGIWTWGPRHDQFWGSEQWRAMLGYAGDEHATLEGFLQRIHPLDRDRVGHAMALALANRASFSEDFRVLAADGNLHWIASRGRTVKDEGTAHWQMFGAVSDITTRKQTEFEVARQRDQLAHLSRVSTLGALSGSLAHELNQPLTAILSNAQAAQRFLAGPEPDLGELREILDDIVAEDKRAGEIISRLRLLFRGGEMALVPLSLNAIIVDVLKLLNSDLVRNGIQVQLELAEDLPLLSGDRVGLQQVLINLIMNASEAMSGAPRSQRRLTIGTRLADADSAGVSVADCGPGIGADHLDRIFDAFFTDKPTGMGLGLSVCRTIVQSHGGRLWAENLPEGGAVFRMTLPLRRR